VNQRAAQSQTYLMTPRYELMLPLLIDANPAMRSTEASIMSLKVSHFVLEPSAPSTELNTAGLRSWICNSQSADSRTPWLYVRLFCSRTAPHRDRLRIHERCLFLATYGVSLSAGGTLATTKLADCLVFFSGHTDDWGR
jgi:hypothetical protein